MVFDKFNEKEQIFCNSPKEIELKIESKASQHIIKLNNISMDSSSLEIRKESFNPHLKEITMYFKCNNVSSELFNIYNDIRHKIVSMKIKYELYDFKTNKEKYIYLELNNLIMYIDAIEFCNESFGMNVELKGHMVV